MASTSTDLSWTYALCNDNPSSRLASSRSTSSTAIDFIIPYTPNLDSTDTNIPTDTSYLSITTS